MFSDKELIFTAETTPDLSMDLESSVNKIIPLVGLADAVNITDSPNCKTKLSSILVAAEIKRKGLDVILKLTGRDRNRIAIESEIIGAASIDINKVLCLTGDQPDEDGPKAVNEFNGASLIELINILNSGKITDGTEIASTKEIFAGAADDLYTHQSKPEAIDSGRMIQSSSTPPARIFSGPGFREGFLCLFLPVTLFFFQDRVYQFCKVGKIQGFKQVVTDTQLYGILLSEPLDISGT